MNLFECPRIDDAAGWVLRALPDGEAESYRHHVTECEECSAKVAELGFVSHALLSSVPQLSAPPDIRSRVMSTVRAEAELLQASGASADRPVRRQSRFGLGFGFGWLNPVSAGALAVVLLALGLGVGIVTSGGGSGPCTMHAVTVSGAAAAAKAGGTLKVCDGHATLALVGMPRPPAGRGYQSWGDDPRDKQLPKAIGALFSVRGGRASVDLGDLHGAKQVLVTDESWPDGPKAGAAPTGSLVVAVSA